MAVTSPKPHPRQREKLDDNKSTGHCVKASSNVQGHQMLGLEACSLLVTLKGT